MTDNTCISCGRIIPEGAALCLHCGDYDDQQRFARKQTNADRIRSMTTEELIPIVRQFVCTWDYADRPCPETDCDACVRRWLEREAEA